MNKIYAFVLGVSLFSTATTWSAPRPHHDHGVPCAGSWQIVANGYQGSLIINGTSNGNFSGGLYLQASAASNVVGHCSKHSITFTRTTPGQDTVQSYQGSIEGDSREMRGTFIQNNQAGIYDWSAFR